VSGKLPDEIRPKNDVTSVDSAIGMV